MALRTLILENCHESLLARHAQLDSHELCSLTTTLETRGDSSKLDNQIKSEIMITIEAFLCRPTTRTRVDEDSLKYLKKTLEGQSFSRLPRVRSIAKDLMHKLKNPETLAPKKDTNFPIENLGLAYSQSSPQFQSNSLAPKVDKKDRIYISPRHQNELPAINPYQLSNSNEFPKQKPVNNFQNSESLGKVFNFDRPPQGTEQLPGQNSLLLPVFASSADKDPFIPPLPLLVSVPMDEMPLPPITNQSALSFAGQPNNLEIKPNAGSQVISNSSQPFDLNVDPSSQHEDLQLQSSPQLRQKRDELKLKKLPQSSANKHLGSQIEHEHGELPDLKRGLFLIEDPLLRMTRGKGWGPNIRAKNYLKKHSGMNQYDTLEDASHSERLQARREQRSKQRSEFQYLIGKNKNDSKSISRSVGKFNVLDELGEKKRKRRLLLISKGLDPDDPNAEEKLKEILVREEEEANNVFLKSRLS